MYLGLLRARPWRHRLAQMRGRLYYVRGNANDVTCARAYCVGVGARRFRNMVDQNANKKAFFASMLKGSVKGSAGTASPPSSAPQLPRLQAPAVAAATPAACEIDLSGVDEVGGVQRAMPAAQAVWVHVRDAESRQTV
jgi:hypothetical protein